LDRKPRQDKSERWQAMSAIDDFDKRRLADRRAKSRERAEGLLIAMARETSRCHLPLSKRIDGWRVSRADRRSPLYITDGKTGVTHARSTPHDPCKLCPRFTPPLIEV